MNGDLLALAGGRSLISAGFSMVSVTSPQLLFEINGRDHAKAEQMRALVETLNTVGAFFVRPLVGNFIDSYGRLPALVIGPFLSAISRLILVFYPRKSTYIAYRFFNLISLIPLLQAFTATLADRFGGRGSEEYIKYNKFIYMWLAFVRILSLRMASRIRSKKMCFVVASVFNICASGIFFTSVKESLRDSERKPFVLKQAANPFSFVRFFSQTSALRSLALVTLFQAIPMYNGSKVNYMRAKFNWGVREQANMQQLTNVLDLFSPLYSVPIMKQLGQRRTAIFAHITAALCDLNTSINSDARSIFLNQVAESIFDSGAMEVLSEQAASSVHAGQGELSAAMMNLRFPLGVLLPNAFSQLYTMSFHWDNQLRGSAPFLACSFVNFLVGTMLIPFCWDSIIKDK
mmetsp:Transcript_41137/g.66259  ORF Transcript_41137/g.66259 Transcript_41137/m.66259 type:complete len:403 (+) Transcript_41137:275-1483(+)|eukprot:CAMPEP_0203768454 /NCGR_PEP_ID=MMETSP0099_2-20121227/1596_1 /ASSEMBLY_ACC=CAM_ASM_000209 /TAXON_ID=96639 /ORGANISM=" , Strain NY0313808BC1" /LENGTH=402 /DNA_ID=CAMNT_0050665145 /DNA_START=425 /DNA_END=1633 /DNA_ORIENTATION=+